MGEPGAPHCPRCADYESRVMARNPAEPAPADLKPCEGYVMSRGFRDWLAAQVRRELAPQFSGAGLDRLKRVKRRTSE